LIDDFYPNFTCSFCYIMSKIFSLMIN
jgi:predicted DsbA family dithiol-disulfide isomerase